jgi:guanylate kinase
MTGRVFILSAPSGAGKTTLIHALLARRPSLRFSVSCTTRPRRPGEVDGRDYRFVSAEEFRRLAATGELLEHAWVFGNGYGTPARPVAEARARDEDVLLDIDWQGARQVRQTLPEAVSILVLPPSYAELERRLRARGTDDPQALARRFADARTVLDHAPEYEHLVVNDDLERAVGELGTVLDDPRTATSARARAVLAALRADLPRGERSGKV